MALRSVQVVLSAATGAYTTAMGNAAQTTDKVGKSLIGIGLAAGAASLMAVKKFADFDQQMSAVEAATHATTDSMNQLRDAAMEAGARTSFSAVEAAQGIEELAKAGVSTADILAGGLNGALDLAAAGSLGVGEAAEIAATALTQFKLEGREIPHVADLLAAGAGKAQGSVQDMGMALKQSGLVAAQYGLSIEETTAGLASFASAGLVGSDAGTSFKSMLQRLTPVSAEASSLMAELGFSAFDAQGNFIGLEGVADELQTSLVGMTDEQRNATMATLFGSDAVRAAAVLYDQGASGIENWTDKVNDQGYAAETSRRRLNNLNGDLEALSESFETAMIKTGSAGDSAARSTVQWATGVVNAYGEWEQSSQSLVLTTGVLTAGVGLAGGAMLLLIPRIAATRAAMSALGLTTGATGVALSALSAAAVSPGSSRLPASTSSTPAGPH